MEWVIVFGRRLVPPVNRAFNSDVNAIEIEKLVKSYGPVRALDGLSLLVPRGCIFGFLGPNGAGKTTTIRILMGLLRSDGGRAAVNGLDAWRASRRIREWVGYLPGDLRLYDRLTGGATLQFLAAARGGVDPAEIERLSARFELNPERRVRQYSKGNRQKIGIVQALMHRPEVLILDEPASSLDPLMQQALYDEIRTAAARGATVLFSSHTISEVESLCSDVAIVRNGRIVESGRIDVLRQRAGRRVEFRASENGRPATVPEGLTVRDGRNGRCVCSWRGETGPLLRWLADSNVTDVTIEPPDLEELFLGYYSESPGQPTDGPTDGRTNVAGSPTDVERDAARDRAGAAT